jgi:hypothetical protein
MSANYSSIGDTLGRAEEFMIYKNSNNRGITLSTQFVADGYEDLHGDRNGRPSERRIRDEGWVQHMVYRLLALTKPIYDRDEFLRGGGGTSTYTPPPIVLLTHGVRFICTPCIVTDVTLSDADGAMIDGFGALPQVVNVEVQLKTAYPYGHVPGYINIYRAYSQLQVRRTPIEGDTFSAVLKSFNAKGVTENLGFNAGLEGCRDVLIDLESSGTGSGAGDGTFTPQSELVGTTQRQ